MLTELQNLFVASDYTILEEQISDEITKIDEIVGSALGLTPEDIQSLQADMGSDPFLSRVRPRYPFFRPRQHGRRPGLDLATRYRGAA
jgi:hypothetical protein